LQRKIDFFLKNFYKPATITTENNYSAKPRLNLTLRRKDAKSFLKTIVFLVFLVFQPF